MKKPPAAKAKSPVRSAASSTQANVPVEFTFTARGAYVDPFNQVVLDAVFTDPAGTVRRVPAFWAGGKTWKVRYASPLAGAHSFRTECSAAGDAGLHGITGRVTVKLYTGKNPLYRHGPIEVASNKRHFQHADGTPFFWLGDTWWMGLSRRLQWPQGFKQLAADRVQKGFNVVQIIAGLYPDMYAFDPRGANEAGYPWEENYAHMRPAYFDKADERLAHLVAQGITPCIVGAWGYFISWMTEAQLKAHWRYLIGRYGAWPVVWCTGGEANLPWYLAKNFPEDDRTMVTGWTKIIRYLRETDPFHRPISIHPTAINRYTSRNCTEDEALIDFDLMQCCHGENEANEIMTKAVRETYAATPRMPVLNGEPVYENLGGKLNGVWPRRAFWSCVLNGAIGHTYGGNGIWQCNQPGIPHGASPHGGNYGETPWQEAMHYPGSGECALGKKFITRFDWTQFEPHPAWAAYARAPWLSLDGAQWIWTSPLAAVPVAKDAPNQRHFFRKTFTLPAGQKVVRAHLRLINHLHTEAELNGTHVAVAWDRSGSPQFNDLAQFLKPGRNSLALWTEHRPSNGRPAGVLACLELTFANGRVQRFASDASWKAWSSKLEDWQTRDFDDSAWPAATVIGQLGDQPWGPVATPDADLNGPQSAGIPGRLRITYVPYAEAIVQSDLGAGTKWRATHFDPVTGREKKLPHLTAGADGTATVAALPNSDRDWVLLLEREA